MQRIAIRFFVILVVLGGGWIAYQLSDVTTCSGPKAESWANASLQRMDDSTNDMDSITDYTTTGQYNALEKRAKSRYIVQQNETAPKCLKELQTISTDTFYYEWKAFESFTDGYFDESIEYLEKAISSYENMEREFYQLAAKYKWDISE